MLQSLADTVAFYAGVVGVISLAAATRRRRPGSLLYGAVVLVEVAFVTVALGESVRWVTGERVPQPVVHVAYLVVSVAIVPIIAGRGALGARDRSSRPAEASVLAIALIAAAIVELRLLATG